MAFPGLTLSTAKIKENNRPVKVLQFGEGNFLRAFVDWMVFEMNHKANFNGSVQVVQPINKGLCQMLNQQNGLYHLFLTGQKNGQPVNDKYLIDVIANCNNPYTNFNQFINTATLPEIKFVVSNTTEAGIVFNPDDKPTDAPPASFPAKLLLWLKKRFDFFKGSSEAGMVMIPCELIDKNGEKLKEVLLQLTQTWGWGQGFADWLTQSCAFCNTLVDRIVPGYPKDRADEITNDIKLEDKLLCTGEQFHLWVIEGPKYLPNILPTQQAGLNVVFTNDLQPYRTQKVRLLNGAHTTMVPVAYLFGLDTVGQTVNHPQLGQFVKDAMFQEIIPTLDLPTQQLQSYAEQVINRFKNPFINHFLISISLNSTSKFKTRVLPSLLAFVKLKNTLPKRLVFSFAALLAFYRGKRGLQTIALNDNQDRLDLMAKLWTQQQSGQLTVEELVQQVLAQTDYWGQDLNTINQLPQQIAQYLTTILEQGMPNAIEEVL